MNRTCRFLAGAVAVLAATGCYHTTIETGLPAGPQTVSVPWAHSFIYGLVPPATVETAKKCPNGVAKVETQMSFLNGLVGGITGGIYTPLQIDVTCASSNRMSSAGGVGATDKVVRAANATPEAQTLAVNQAAAIALALKVPVYVVF